MTKRGKKYYANFRYDGKLIRKVLSPSLRVAKVMLRDLRMKVSKRVLGTFPMTTESLNWRMLGSAQSSREQE